MVKRKTTINDLPYEVIALIVEEVEHQAAHAHFPGLGGLGGLPGQDLDDDGIGGINPADALGALFGGLFGGGGAAGAGAAPGANPPGAGGNWGGLFGGLGNPAGRNRAGGNAVGGDAAGGGAAGGGAAGGGAAGAGRPLNPNAPAFTFGGQPGRMSDSHTDTETEDDSDMPPLERELLFYPAFEQPGTQSRLKNFLFTAVTAPARAPAPATGASTSTAVPPSSSAPSAGLTSATTPAPSTSRNPFNFFGLGGSCSTPSPSAAAPPVLTAPSSTAASDPGSPPALGPQREADSDVDSDDLPPLEPISTSPILPSAPLPASNTSTTPAASEASAPAPRTGGIASFLSAFTNPLRSVAGAASERSRSGSRTPTARTANAAATPRAATAQNSDDDMPPLESIPASTLVRYDSTPPAQPESKPKSKSTGFSFGPSASSSSKAASSSAPPVPSSDDDDMPPLESINAPSPSTAPTSTKQSTPKPKSNGFSFGPSSSSFKVGAAPLAATSDEDDMPPLESINPVPAASSTSGKGKGKASVKGADKGGKGKGKAPAPDPDFEDILSLESIALSPSAATPVKGEEKKAKTTAKSSGFSFGPSSSSSAKKPVVVESEEEEDSDSSMPPLESISSKPAAKKAKTSSTLSAAPSSAKVAAAAKKQKPGNGFSFGPSSSSSSSTAARPTPGTPQPVLADSWGWQDEDEDSMPELVDVGAKAKAQGRKKDGEKGKKASVIKKEEDDDDSMPELENINDKTPKSNANAKVEEKKPASGSASNGSTKQKQKKPAVVQQEEDDDSMPELEDVNATAGAKKSDAPKLVRGKGKMVMSAARKLADETDEDMPELEPIPDAPFTFTFVSPYFAKKSAEIAAKMPALSPFATAAGSSTARAASTAPSSNSTLPRDYAFSFTSPPTATTPLPSTSAAPTRSAGESSDDDMPLLESINAPALTASAPPAVPTALAPTRSAPDLPRCTDVGLPGFMPSAAAVAAAGSDGEWEDTGGSDGGADADEEGEEHEDEDEDGYDEDLDYDSDDSDAPQRIYPDGLPTDPLLPLLYINRAFLHASRKILYRRIHCMSPFQASLLLRALEAEESAGYLPGDEGEAGEGEEARRKNMLGEAVRTLSIDAEGDASLGRGGAQIYIDLIKASSKHLESLTVRPMLLKSATKPFLAALETLNCLKSVDLTSSTDPHKPFLVTVPRVVSLLRHTWYDLENLTIQGLKSGEMGPEWELDDMWEEAQEEDDSDYLEEEEKKLIEEEKKKRKGLKKIELFNLEADANELEEVLKDSKETLIEFTLSRPSLDYDRQGLASTLLTFGAKLTSLVLVLPPIWHTAPRPGNGVPKKPFPVKSKDYKVGKPDYATLSKIADYHYVLDAIMPYLPALKELRFDGPHASTSIFSFFPPSLTKLTFGHCPAIQPAALAKLLRKTVTRTKQVVNADGARVSKSFQTKVARGLTCMSINHDDLNYSPEDLADLEDAVGLRACCLHLSGDAGGGFGGAVPLGGFGGAVPLGGLGGLGGLMGGGIPLVPVVMGGGAGAAPGAAGGVGGAARRAGGGRN
ncbi:hypothetical protein JCM11641_001540 [Rhodosporidiobolus odoratus]